MRATRVLSALLLAAVLVAGNLMAGAPHGVAATKPPSVAGVALSPATNHLFVLSYTLSGSKPGASSVTMLDASSGANLRVVSVGKAGRGIVVDDATGHVFVTTVTETQPLQATILSTTTGKFLSHVKCGDGTGTSVDMQLASQSHRLIITQDRKSTTRLHVIDTASGAHLRSVTVPRSPYSLACGTCGLPVESTGHLFVATGSAHESGPSDNILSIYDLQTWKLVKRVGLPGRLVGMAALNQQQGVLVANGSTVKLLDAQAGAVRWTIQLNPIYDLAGLQVDSGTGRVFVWDGGSNPLLPQPYRPGSVITIDVNTHKVVRTVSLDGVPAGGLVGSVGSIDPAIHHLLTLSARTVQKTGQPIKVTWRLNVLDTRTGRLLHRVALPMDVWSLQRDVDSAHSRAYIGSWNKGLMAADTRTGALQPIKLAPQP